jgi:hypothetical protein
MRKPCSTRRRRSIQPEWLSTYHPEAGHPAVDKENRRGLPMGTSPSQPNPADSSTLRRDVRGYRIGPRDYLQFGYLVAAVLIVGVLGLFAFGLLFNGITIFAWLFAGGVFAFTHRFNEKTNKL